MTKLTELIRADIIRAAITKALEKEMKRIEEMEFNLADTIYATVFTKEGIEKLRGLPSGWVPEDGKIAFRVGSMGWNVVRCRAPVRLPHSRSHGCLLAADSTSAIGEAWFELAAAKKDLEETKAQIKMAIRPILNSVTTVNRLKTVWPDVVEFLPTIYSAPAVKASLPAVQIEHVNNLLKGLRHA